MTIIMQKDKAEELKNKLIKELVKNLSSENWVVRQKSAIALGELEKAKEDILISLLSILKDENESKFVIVAVLKSLIKLFGNAESFEFIDDEKLLTLIKLLNIDHVEVCEQSALLLATIINRVYFFERIADYARRAGAVQKMQTMEENQRTDKELEEIREIAKNGIRNSFY